jgi:hypothetical protein
MRTAWLALGTLFVMALAPGCSTYRDQLARSQRAFEVNEHERTLALLRDLEPDVHRLSDPEQAQYCYLRGMSDLRLGFRADARHWLALAKTHDDASPGVLPADWKARLGEALEELNGVVYQDGTAALHRAPEQAADSEPSKGEKKKAKPAQ